MSTRSVSQRAIWLALALAVPLLAACGASSGIVGGSTKTPTPKATATPTPPPHAIAWVQPGGGGSPAAIWASINDGPPTQITHVGPPNMPCVGPETFGSPMFSPDLAHIVVAAAGCTVDSQIYGSVDIVTVAGGAIAQVPLPAPGVVLTNVRSYGWIDTNTIFALGPFTNGPGGVRYTLGAGSTTPLTGIPNDVIEGVARGATLFYATADSTSGGGFPAIHTVLHRYSLSSPANLPGTIDLGGFGMFPGSPGDFHYEGWDASPDGEHVVYQVTVAQRFVEVQGGGGIASQAVYYAKADGSGASQIVQYMVTKSNVRMRISPNGKLVGITEAFGTPDVLSGCVDSPGKKGDPCLQFYSPDAVGYPAWIWDSSNMIATASGGPPTVLYRYTPGHFAGAIYAAAGYNPWSTP